MGIVEKAPQRLVEETHLRVRAVGTPETEPDTTVAVKLEEFLKEVQAMSSNVADEVSDLLRPYRHDVPVALDPTAESLLELWPPYFARLRKIAEDTTLHLERIRLVMRHTGL